MKPKYQHPKVEIIKLDNSDIITASECINRGHICRNANHKEIMPLEGETWAEYWLEI